MLRNYWYIACATTQLASAPRATRVLDQDLVCFRDSAGHPHALLDRCCHRGTPLSFGEVVDGCLACRYHGWRYDGSGTCVHIPSLTSGRRIPPDYEVPACPCLEHDGYIWVWMGTSIQAPTYHPSVPEFTQYAWLQGARDWRCSSLRALENNVDCCHPAFAHPGTHPRALMVQEHGLGEQGYEMRTLPQGLVVFAPPTTSADDPIPEQPWFVLRFELPDRVTVQRPRAHELIIMHFVPTGANTCRLEWLRHPAGLTGSGVSWTEEESTVLAQDRRILEGAQRWYDQGGEAFERSVEGDAAPLMVRRIVALAAQGRWEAERSALRQRRVVIVRA